MKKREDEILNPETAPLRQWPFIYDPETQHWYLEWSEFIGFLIGIALVAFTVFVIGMALIALVEI